MSEKKLTEKEVRKEYKDHRKYKAFAQCWPDTNRAFYEWCSGYLNYKHIKEKDVR
tara:strand:+ start:102 stop:266 length:165 start_codon:yes stop_codon:yes gene_type:complete